MTKRERVLKTINHEQPDMIPIDIGGSVVTGIAVDEYVSLCKRLYVDALPPKVFDQFQLLARVDEPIRSWFQSDVIQLENCSEAWGLTNKDWKIWRTIRGNDVLVPGDFNILTDERGYKYIIDASGNKVAYTAPDGLYFERYFDNYVSDKEMPSPEEWSALIPMYTDEELNLFEKRAKLLYENTDYAIIGNYGRAKFHSTGMFAGHTFTDWLCRLYTDEEYCFEILEATAKRHIENLKRYLEAIGDYIQIILVSTTDFGTQRSEIFSPDIFERIYKPNIKLLNDYIHMHSTVKTMYHSCGSIRSIIGHMIEAGVDILNPVQTNAENMKPSELKEAFGEKVVFWGGGIETQTVLPNGSAQDIDSHIKDRMDIFGKGGGFVFAPVHNIQSDVPVENIVAMRNAALKYRTYN